MLFIKKGFSLIEVMLSILIIGLITSYLYGTLGQVKKSNLLLFNKNKDLIKKEKFLSILNRDILESNSLTISTIFKNENSMLSLRTKNSFYNSHYVYVKWILNEDLNKILRFESTKDFKIPVREERLYWVHIDSIYNDISVFKFFLAKNKDKVLLYLKNIKKKESIFEFYKPN